jgi:hypothetical protein
MCDVPSTAVFCSESIECFPGRASKFFFKFFFTIPAAPMFIGIIIIIITIIIGIKPYGKFGQRPVRRLV